ncbi:MAG: hypothetical protein AAF251_08420 [Pseudomonadota bacterium]
MSAAKKTGVPPNAPPMPQPVLAVGITGHSHKHPSFPTDPSALFSALESLFGLIERVGARTTVHGLSDAKVRFRLVTLLTSGIDQMAAEAALERQWGLSAPVPFGRNLNTAIAAAPRTVTDAKAILAGQPPKDAGTSKRAKPIHDLMQRANVFEMAEQDAEIQRAFLDTLDHPDQTARQVSFLHFTSQRAQLAGQILLEQSDILIAVWDGQSTIAQGGTGHTAKMALEAGIPVIWIDPENPGNARLMQLPEQLSACADPLDQQQLESAVSSAVQGAIGLGEPSDGGRNAGLEAVSQKAWRGASSISSHAFRRVETLFGESGWARKFRSIRQRYESPDNVADGHLAPLLSVIGSLGEDGLGLRAAVETKALPTFAWTDAIASQMADRYRSGMVINFTLGALAIISGVLYLPLVETSQKWMFASIELGLLLAIVLNTVAGQKLRLHGRWLETRRVAEYCRHAPLLYVFGVARPLGRWPVALRSHWPEWYARMVVRNMGLVSTRVDSVYLRTAAQILRDHFVDTQLKYHQSKSERLHRAHHTIERVAERLFALAIIIVTTYLTLSALAALGVLDSARVTGFAKWFTVIAIALPTVSGALAAIGFFGDFDRFADISQATSERLAALRERIDAFLCLPDDALGYEQFANLARGADAIVFEEIQAWQSVFSGKRITVPA